MTIVLLVAGLAMLVVGADLLVRGASRLAAAMGASPLVIGLTVVAFGTSAPEIAASLTASLAGRPELALANAVGSNIFNVFGILGATAVVVPLTAAARLVRIDVPVVLAASLALLWLATDGVIGRLDGGLLLGFIIGHTAWTVLAARRGGPSGSRSVPASPAGVVRLINPAGAVVTGLVALVVGGRWLVAGSVAAATWLGISERVVGLTIVAVGTSLPELATSVVAAFRNEKDIAVGNVVGSNLFNLTAVVGLAAVGARGGVSVSRSALTVDLPVMIATAAICLPVFFTGFVISRREGLAFLAALTAYLGWLVVDASGHIIPASIQITVVGIAAAALTVTATESFRQLRRSRPGSTSAS